MANNIIKIEDPEQLRHLNNLTQDIHVVIPFVGCSRSTAARALFEFIQKRTRNAPHLATNINYIDVRTKDNASKIWKHAFIRYNDAVNHPTYIKQLNEMHWEFDRIQLWFNLSDKHPPKNSNRDNLAFVIEQVDLSVAIEYFDINYAQIDAKKRKIDPSDDDFSTQDYCADLERHNTNLTLTIEEQKEKVTALEKEAKDKQIISFEMNESSIEEFEQNLST
jgi:hypothetical protein